MQRIGINVGWAAGPALGGAFAHESYGLMFFASVPLLLLAAWATRRVGETIKAVAPAGKDTAKGVNAMPATLIAPDGQRSTLTRSPREEQEAGRYTR